MAPTLTWALFFAGLAALVLAVLAAPGQLRPLAGWCLTLIGPVLGATMVLTAYAEGDQAVRAPQQPGRQAGQLRISLIEARVAGTRLSIGGDPAKDDIVVSELPPGAIRLNATSEPGGWVTASLAIDREVMRITPGGHSQTFCPRAKPGNDKDRPTITREAFVAAKAVERLSVARANGTWTICFERPQSNVANGGNVQPTSADLANQPRDGDNVVVFKALGGRFAPLLESYELVLPQSEGQRTYVRGSDAGYQPNGWVELAGSDGDGIAVRVDPLNLTTGLRGLVKPLVLLTLLAAALLTWRTRLASPVAAGLYAVAEALLVLRILFAVEGGTVASDARTIAALGDALVALPGGLMVMAAALEVPRRLPFVLAVLAGCGAVALAMQNAADGAIAPTTIQAAVGAVGLVAGVWLLRWIGAHVRPAGLWTRVFGGSRVTQAPSLTDALVAATVIASPVLVLRLVLMILKIDDHVGGPGESYGAVSLVVVPLTLLAASPLIAYLARAESATALRNGALAFGVFIFVVVLIANSVLSNDNGLSIMLGVSLALAAATVRFARAPQVSPVTLAIVFLGGLGAVFALSAWLGGGLVRGVTGALLMTGAGLWLVWRRRAMAGADALWLAPAAIAASLVLVTAWPGVMPAASGIPGDVGAMAEARVPVLRLAAALAPERFAFIESGKANELRAALGPLAGYTAEREGQGFLAMASPPDGIRNQQFSDYAVAVHLISPFGRLAAAGVLMLVGALAMLVFARTDARRPLAAFGLLAAITFAATTTYVTLANALLAPFTGRNAYLLAPRSLSDLGEGLMLLAIAALAVSAGTRERAA